MVFPTIKIDGVVHDIEYIEYKNGKPSLVTVMREGNKFYIWDKAFGFNDGDALDLTEVISWEGRYEQVDRAFENLVTTYDAELSILSKQIAKLYIEESAIHPSLVEKYEDLKQLIRATTEVKNALNLILYK